MQHDHTDSAAEKSTFYMLILCSIVPISGRFVQPWEEVLRETLLKPSVINVEVIINIYIFNSSYAHNGIIQTKTQFLNST